MPLLIRCARFAVAAPFRFTTMSSLLSPFRSTSWVHCGFWAFIPTFTVAGVPGGSCHCLASPPLSLAGRVLAWRNQVDVPVSRDIRRRNHERIGVDAAGLRCQTKWLHPPKCPCRSQPCCCLHTQTAKSRMLSLVEINRQNVPRATISALRDGGSCGERDGDEIGKASRLRRRVAIWVRHDDIAGAWLAQVGRCRKCDRRTVRRHRRARDGEGCRF